MSGAADAGKTALAVFVAALLQVTIVASMEPLGGTPDLLLVTLVALALLRGPIVGASAGFFGGLVVDTMTLDTLGFTSLLLTVAGYWIGRYGETTGRDRAHAPVLSVFVVTILYAVGALLLHAVLGDGVSARYVILESLPPTILANLVLTFPVYAIVRRAMRTPPSPERVGEVRLLG